MQCTRPLLAVDLGSYPNEDGVLKKKLKLVGRFDMSTKAIEEKYGANNILKLPCGKCLACRLNYSRSWAIRCCLEAEEYDDNYFVTITYDDEHLPDSPDIVKKDIQKYIKRVRKKYGEGVRYFACCERGELNGRLHAHIIFFNLKLTDVKCIGRAKFGYYYASSDLIRCWPNGFTTIGEVSYHSCNYVARYVIKKVGDDGSFLLMSRRPGIGANYFYKHYKDIYDDDTIYFNFGNSLTSKPGRYFDKLFESLMPERFEEIKEIRLSKSNAVIGSELLRSCVSSKEEFNKKQASILDEKVTAIKKRRI